MDDKDQGEPVPKKREAVKKISAHQPKFVWKQTSHHGIVPFKKYNKEYQLNQDTQQ